MSDGLKVFVGIHFNRTHVQISTIAQLYIIGLSTSLVSFVAAAAI